MKTEYRVYGFSDGNAVRTFYTKDFRLAKQRMSEWRVRGLDDVHIRTYVCQGNHWYVERELMDDELSIPGVKANLERLKGALHGATQEQDHKEPAQSLGGVTREEEAYKDPF